MRCSVDGQEIDYEVRGDGRPIVVVHGLTTDRRYLIEACEPVLDRPGVRRIYLDLPGHGASSQANLVGASADGLIDALKGFVREVAGEEAAVVAHSYAAYLALGLARELPSLSGLFLACPIVHPDIGWRTLPAQRYVTLEDGLKFIDEMEQQTFNGEICVQTAEVLERFRRVLDPAHRVAMRLFVDLVRSKYVMTGPVSRSLAAFDKPVLVVCGQNDYWAGFEDAIHLVRAFPRCDLRLLSRCGHFLPVEAPARFGVVLGEWLEELGRAQPPMITSVEPSMS